MIQSTIKTEESKPVNEWPKLMIHEDGEIILVDNRGNGFCLHSGDKSRIGITGSFNMSVFTTFTGEITLRNE